MNILFVSKDLSGGDLCIRLKNEGHNVRLFIEDESQKSNYGGMVEKTSDWKQNIDWVGKDGLFVFDGIGFGKEQDTLRLDGYSVVGGSGLGDRLEHDRQYGQKIFSTCGIPIVSSANFGSVDEAIEFIKGNEGPWVVKQNGHKDKIFNYVGNLKDGSDVISLLNNYYKQNPSECSNIDIQKKIVGIEIGVARYFNGNDWIGPIEINLEHKDLIAGNLGPKTYEMGTLIWYEKDENNRIFQATLGKLKEYLKKINFRGDIDINCIINEDVIYPLEVTARFGWPATHIHSELHLSPWGDFLKAIADGNRYDLKYKEEYGIVVLIATPPFPYQLENSKYSPRGERILFSGEMREGDFKHIHFEDVSRDEKGYYISGDGGFILHLTQTGKTVEDARKKVYEIAKKVIIPKMFYRNDIGLKFFQEEFEVLKKWNWI
ncbi:MAG: hypothetical protein HGA61_00355 [Candidatus Moranbacteria bacterium]|nr:hypothetical protein [Candidatus Moranbacteria bacterium]